MPGDVKRVFVASTSADLAPYRKAAKEVILDLGGLPIMWEHWGGAPEAVVEKCRLELATCQLVVLLQAWQRGRVPSVAEGGNGVDSITALELKEATDGKIKTLTFLANDDWPKRLVERERVASDWVEAFHKKLMDERPSPKFSHEPEPLLAFRALLLGALAKHMVPGTTEPPRAVSLRTVPGQPLPGLPYPVLSPYEHPATFAGRDRDLDDLLAKLDENRLILCVHAPSGAGKSSLLRAGLLPRLRSRGVPVALHRHPEDPGVARALVASVLDIAEDEAVPDDAPLRFAEWVVRARTLAAAPPVLVLDQFEDAFKRPEKRDEALARIGPLLAATARASPGAIGPPCRWVLAYRHEFHGRVRAWLADVLVEARRAKPGGIAALPYRLSTDDRSHDWSLPVFGTPPGGPREAVDAVKSFRDAIVKPLRTEEGTPRYPWRFASEADERRLAEAFADARARLPHAPLVPELQVVLARLMDEAKQGDGSIGPMHVPEAVADVAALIDHALERHLRRALDEAFVGADHATAREGRARALVALGALADAQGRTTEGLPREDLLKRLGPRGEAVLETLASAGVRLLVEESDGTCILSHDRLAEAVRRLLSDQDERRRQRLDLDESLVDLDRFVERRTHLHATSGDPVAANLNEKQHAAIAAKEDALIVDDERRKWWDASTARHEGRRRGRRRQLAVVAVAVLVIGCALGVGVWRLTLGQAREREWLASLADPKRAIAFDALAGLVRERGYDGQSIRHAHP